MRCPALPLLLALLSLALAACSSFTPPSTAVEDASGKWVLAQEKDSPSVITLVRGMSPATVTKLVGQPLYTRKLKKAVRPTEEWTYRRYLLGGHAISSAISKNHGYTTAYQRVVYIETLELTFIDGALDKVHSSRTREDMEPGAVNNRRF